MELSKDTVLQRAFDIDIRIEGERISARLNDKYHQLGTHSLMILDAFATPKSLARGIQELQAAIFGTRDWIRLTQQILGLAHVGFLRRPQDNQLPLRSHRGRFSSPNVHIRMLNDQARTHAYRQALFKLVRPEDTVLDIGTGTGILAATAALAGARHVYAVERSSNLSKLARKFFDHNGLGEKITIIEGDSSRIELPEKADVLVSEIIGNDPLAEGILPCYEDARRRLLKPLARLIPGCLRIFALPLTAPASFRRRLLFSESSALHWEEQYLLDFTNYVEETAARNFHGFANSYHLKDWPRIAKPILVAEIDFSVGHSERVNCVREFVAEQDGSLNAIAILFEAELAEDISLSVLPDQATQANSWASLIWLPGTPMEVRRDEALRISYRYGDETESQIDVTRLNRECSAQ